MKKFLLGSVAIAGLLNFANAEFDIYGHFGVYGESNLDNKRSDYAGLSASVGFNALFGDGFAVGLGGWAAIPIYEDTKKFADNIYKDTFVLSEAYFSYSSDPFSIAIGRYNTNEMGYEWFSGHNEGASISFGIGNFMDIWAMYSYEQAFQFQRFNRETASQINALWNYKRHMHVDKEHLGAAGVDIFIGDVFTISPYAFFVTDSFFAPGVTLDLLLGDKTDLYSQTQFKYTYYDSIGPKMNRIGDGQLFLIDQEFGYDWFRIGGGYYKTTGNGVGGLTYYGDRSRFYGGMVGANFYNKASGSYFNGKQSTWYAFTGARHDVFKFDLLYAGGGYKELSALFSITLFKHLDFGAGYIDLADIGNNKRNYLTGFVKAIW